MSAETVEHVFELEEDARTERRAMIEAGKAVSLLSFDGSRGRFVFDEVLPAPSSPRDRFGFPLVQCRRCAGSGSFGPVSVENARCFGCGGTGWKHRPGKVEHAFAAYSAALRAHRRPALARVVPGDRIRRNSSEPLRTVAAVEWVSLRRSVGGARLGVEGTPGFVEYSTPGFEVLVTFEGGEVVNFGWSNVGVQRAGGPEVGPYLAAAGVRVAA